MLSYNSRHLLKELLIQIGQQERQLEVVRQILCEQPEFEPYTAFRRIDRLRKGFITNTDIFDFLLSNEFKFTEQECSYYINHYDRDFDNRLAYSEFLPSVLPLDNPDLRTITTQRKVYDVPADEFLPYEVEYALSRVIAQEINFYKELEELKSELVNEYDFTFFDAFASIDIYETGYIDYNLLKNFLKTAGKMPKEEQVIECLRRIDKDDDGRIKYEEFVEAIQPVAPGLAHGLSSKKTKRNTQTFSKSRELGASYYGDRKESIEKDVYKKTFKSPMKTTLAASKTFTRMGNTSPRAKFSNTGERFDAGKTFEEQLASRERTHARMSKSTQKLTRPKTPKKKTTGPSAFKEIDPLPNLMLIFKEIINLEREVEFAKQDLALRSDFNLFDAFRIFDRKGKGIITVREFENVFEELEMYPAKEDLYLLIKRLDKDGDGKLKFGEFTAAFAPVQTEYYDLIKSRVAVNGDLMLTMKELFDAQTRKLFKRLLILYLENEAVVEALRQKLNKDKAFNVREAFEMMDLDGDGYVTLFEIREVMDMNDIFMTDKDLEYLVDRFDKQDKRKISYAEFVQELSPKSQKKY